MSLSAVSRRLPRSLRKKLEASLSRLTPDESARLFLLYMHECDRLGQDLANYPPLEELKDAWEGRLDAALREKTRATYDREYRDYNRWFWLAAVAIHANEWAAGELWRLLFGVYCTVTEIHVCLRDDALTQLADQVAEEIAERAPRPATPEEYRRLTEWAEGDALEWLHGDVPWCIASARAEEQGCEYLGVPAEFWEAHRGAFEAQRFWQVEHTEGLRRLYAEAEGEDLLPRYFGGDQALLDSWVVHGGYAGITQDAFDREVTQARERLDAAAQSGPLDAGLAVALPRCYEPVVIGPDGTIPAWAALRAVWPVWVRQQGYRERRHAVAHADHLEGIRVLFRFEDEKDVDAEDLAGLVSDFVADCRGRSWGEGLAPRIDARALARSLVEVETPLSADHAPDLGCVAYEAFRSREGDEGAGWEPAWVATVRSLKANAAALGFDPGQVGNAYILSEYYETESAAYRRGVSARAMGMLNVLRFNSRPSAPKSDGPQPPAAVLGAGFAKSVERRAKSLGEILCQVAAFVEVIDRLSREYFEGLPLLVPTHQERLEAAEQMAARAESKLAAWLDELEREPVNMETSRLRVVRKEPDEGRVSANLGRIRDSAFRSCDLRPDDLEPTGTAVRIGARRR